MTFPTAALLDDFTRADNARLGANWTVAPLFHGDNEVGITGDIATTSGSPDGGGSTWIPNSFSDSIEVWGKIHGPSGQPYLFACASHENDPAGTFGYTLATTAEGGLTLTRFDGPGGATEVGTLSMDALADGDGFGMTIDAGTITGYSFLSGSWAEVGAWTDSTYIAGDVGIGFADYDVLPDGFIAFGAGGTPGTGPGGGALTPAETFVQAKRGLYLTVTDLDGNPITSGINRPLPVKTPDQPQVTIPLSDSRIGSMDVSMYEDIAPALQTATSVVKVLYVNPKGVSILALNGIVLSKVDDFDAGVTTVQLHDSTIRLKKRYLGYNHYSIMLGWAETVSDGDVNALTGGDFDGINSIYGIPLDGTGVRLLLLDTSHGAKDWRGWPPSTSDGFIGVPAMGIRYDPDNSVDTANRQPVYGVEGIPPTGFVIHGTLTEGSPDITGVTFPGGQTIGDVYEYGALSGPRIADFANVVSATGTTIVMSQNATASESLGTVVLEDAIYCQLSRGDCVYDDITDIVQAQGAFECNWEPVDVDHLGPSSSDWITGQLCELHTANRIGTDRSQGNTEGHVPVVFVHGIGGVHVTHSPDADQLRTYVVEVGPGGPADPLDLFNKVTTEADTVPDYGFWEDWEQATSAGNGDNPISNQILGNRANAILTGFQNPPQFVTITVDTDSAAQYAYGSDFFLGDTVTVYAKRGKVTMGPLDVRITQMGITRVDESGNCQLSITAVPYLTASVDPANEAS